MTPSKSKLSPFVRSICALLGLFTLSLQTTSAALADSRVTTKSFCSLIEPPDFSEEERDLFRSEFSDCQILGDPLVTKGVIFVDFSFEAFRSHRCWSASDCALERPGSGISESQYNRDQLAWRLGRRAVFDSISARCREIGCTPIKVGDLPRFRFDEADPRWAGCTAVIPLIAEDIAELRFYLLASNTDLESTRIIEGPNPSQLCRKKSRMILIRNGVAQP